jgi:small subunit ribosomal protein S16
MPFYQIVAADGRSPRDGKFLEVIGHYNPTAKPHAVTIEKDRVAYWLNVGAQPTATVRSLIRGTGLLHEMNLQRRGVSESDIAGQMEAWQQKEAERRQKRLTVKTRRRHARKDAEASAAAASASVEG